MTRWEYLFLTAARGGGGAWKVRMVKGEEQPGWRRGPSLYEYCNRMGEEGWEVIGLSQAPVSRTAVLGFWAVVDRENFRVVLKRPKS